MWFVGYLRSIGFFYRVILESYRSVYFGYRNGLFMSGKDIRNELWVRLED